MTASEQGDLEVVRLLFENRTMGPDESSKVIRAFLMAAQYGRLEVVRFLLENGPSEMVHAQNDMALDLAAMNGYLEVVQLLLENGADIHAEDDRALILAARHDHWEIVQLLLENGANVRAQNDGVLRSAISRTRFKIAQFLLGAGANPNVLPENLRYLAPGVISSSEYLSVQPLITRVFELPDRWVLQTKDSTYILFK